MIMVLVDSIFFNTFSVGEAVEAKRVSDLLGMTWHDSAFALLCSRLLGILALARELSTPLRIRLAGMSLVSVTITRTEYR